MDDLLYLDDGRVKVSDTAMQIPEFKDFKQYDRSQNKSFFDIAMTYIFFVYKVFGDSKNMSYLSNMPYKQRQVYCCKAKTGKYTIEDFEDNRWVRSCIKAYLEYSRTQAEIMFDAFKEDMALYIGTISNIPHTITKTVMVKVSVPGEDRFEMAPVEIEIANIDERMKALKDAQGYKELFSKWEKQVKKENKIKQDQSRMFEKPGNVKKIDLGNDYPIANK